MPAHRYLPSFDATQISAVIEEWKASYPAMGLLALLPEDEKAQVSLIQHTCGALGVGLAGAIFPELLAQGAFRRRGVLLIRFDQMPPLRLLADLPTEEEPLRAVIEDFAAWVQQQGLDPETTSLFMLFDAMVPRIGTILEDLYLHLAESVHYMGANAGSETFQPLPCLFDGERPAQNGLLALLLSPHEGAVLEHGYQPPAQMVAATSTQGNRVLSIDWRPAFDVYRDLILQQFGVEVTPENFYQYGVHYPFGIIRVNDEVLVRIPVALEADGSLFCVGEVPENAVLTLLEAPQANSLQTAERLAGALAGRSSDGILTFYCAGRRLHLGVEAAEAETHALSQRSDGRELFGALSLGEIGSSQRGGYPLFHNATLVCSSL